MSFHQKRKSSTVSGSPSDHLMPSRNLAVRTVASSFQVKLSSRFGRMPVMSRFHLSRGSTQMVWRNQPLSFWLSTMRQVPPYWPTSSTGSITSGDAGRRSSTGGSSPAATFSASMGASAYLPAGAAGWAAAGAASSAGCAGAAAGAPLQAASRSSATTLTASTILKRVLILSPSLFGIERRTASSLSSMIVSLQLSRILRESGKVD